MYPEDDVGAGDAFAAGFLAGCVLTRHVHLSQSAHLAARIAAARVTHADPDWYAPVARSAAEFAAQMPPPAVEQPDNMRRVLAGGEAGETLELLVELAPRFYDAACHLRTASNAEAAGNWTEDALQALVKAMLAALFQDVDREKPGGRHAGKAHRIDILLRRHGIAIELELASAAKRDSAIGRELRGHFADYRPNPSVKAIVGLIFDPDNFLANPLGLERDLSSAEPGEKPTRTIVVGRQTR